MDVLDQERLGVLAAAVIRHRLLLFTKMKYLCYSYFVMRTKEFQSKSTIKNTRLIGIACMLMASFLFSTGGVLIKIIPWNPLSINGVRNVIAAIVIGIYIAATHHKIKVNFTVIVGAVCLAGVTTLFSVANKMTTAGNVIILQNTAPVWIVSFYRIPPRSGS